MRENVKRYEYDKNREEYKKESDKKIQHFNIDKKNC